MVLREADFVAARINWQDKASNLKSIGEELNLTEGSFVFIDDNPIEREIVSGECPDAEVPSFPEDTTELNTFAEKLYVRCFRPLRLLKEDTEKTAMYRTEAKRKALESVSLNLDDYISKLEIEADIHRMKPEELDRTAQLIGKTNQFNLTTKRYTAAEIADMASDPACRIYTVHAKDSTTLTFSEGSCRVSNFGCSALAKGGSGDMLAGLTGSMAAQGVPLETACRLGSYIMGRTAELLCEGSSPAAVTATDIIAELRHSLMVL